MGYDLSKRIASLRQQIEYSQSGRIGFMRAFLYSLLAMTALSILLTMLFGQSFDEPETDESLSIRQEREIWLDKITIQAKERLSWLEGSPFVLFGSDDAYKSFVNSVVMELLPELPPQETEEDKEFSLDDSFFNFRRWHDGIAKAGISILLRMGFVTIAFWPMWLIAFLVGYFGIQRFLLPKRTGDLLGICTPGITPFYSGIYGPLKLNDGKYSGTDYSCPGLACPPMVSRQVALAHNAAQTLKRFDALNETNIGLVQIILAHKDFPRVVAEEHADNEDDEREGNPSNQESSIVNFVTNEKGSLEENTKEGLLAVLEAHEKMVRYFQYLKQKGIKESAFDEHYKQFVTNVTKLSSGISPLGKALLLMLTPKRGKALAELPQEVVASAYLAIEAGKSLVYQRKEGKFAKISRFPHLQARAVIHSLKSYHDEYNGDLRLIIRQAIICSRRHGDFGRAFLPFRMPIESRSLRDWLEVMFADPDVREDTAHLVELDAHIEEIHVNWREQFSRDIQETSKELAKEQYSKGIPHKSVVLVPLKSILSSALSEFGDERCEHIAGLLKLTRNFQTTISISARLPGFRRQALEAWRSGVHSEDFKKLMEKEEAGKELIERWSIVRRMLTRYNWLSTRVGDDAVPVDGLVHCIIGDSTEQVQTPRTSLQALVPLRQRRFDELFGKRWEGNFYPNAPHPNTIHIYVDTKEFETARDNKILKSSAPPKSNSETEEETSAASG